MTPDLGKRPEDDTTPGVASSPTAGSTSSAPEKPPDPDDSGGAGGDWRRRARLVGVGAAFLVALAAATIAVVALRRDSTSPPTWVLLLGSWILAAPMLALLLVMALRTRGGVSGWTKRGLVPLLVSGLVVVLLAATTAYVAGIRGPTCPQRLGPGADLAGCDFAERDLRGEDLHGADLSGADLSGATLIDANLNGVNLRKADLSEARLAAARLGTADLSGANLTKATLDGQNLSGTKLRGAVLDGTSLRQAQLAGADLTGARLKGVALDGTKLEGAVGLTDEQLASGLTVSVNELGRVLKERGMQLEPSDAIRNALQPACLGAPIEGAGSAPGASFHPMIVFGMSPNQTWASPALRFTELVACVDADVSDAVETCPYVGRTTGEQAFRTRNQHSRRVRVVSAATGATVAEQTLQAPPPGPCPETTTSLTPIGAPVRDADVSGFLAPFVGNAPAAPPSRPPSGPSPPTSTPGGSTLSINLEPRSGPAGTTITARATQCGDKPTGTLRNASGKKVADARGTGAYTAKVTVPRDAAPGKYRVEVICRGSRTAATGTGLRVGNATFEVVKKN